MTRLYAGMVSVGMVVLLAAWPAGLKAQFTDPDIKIGPGDLGGVVTSANGPEAGVWVIAETTDLPTKFAKIVVTDDRGRYLMPDLPPKADYSVWVRGYGLVDSPKVRTRPGKILDLTAVVAPTAGRGGGVLSGHLLVFDAQGSGQERVPRHGTPGQRHAREPEEPRPSGSTSSRPTAASRAISSATRRRARSRRSWVNSRRSDRGVGAAHPSPDRP